MGNSQFRADVHGEAERLVTCEKCGAAYRYRLVRRVEFAGHERQAARLHELAERRLDAMLAHDVDPVPCPSCWWIQSTMVPTMRARYASWIPVAGVVLAVAGVLGAVIIAMARMLDPRGDMLYISPWLVAIVVGMAVCGPMAIVGRLLIARWTYPPNGFAAPDRGVGISRTGYLLSEAGQTARLGASDDMGLSYQAIPGVQADGWLPVQLRHVTSPRYCVCCMEETEGRTRVSDRWGARLRVGLCSRCRMAQYRRVACAWLPIAAVFAVLWFWLMRSLDLLSAAASGGSISLLLGFGFITCPSLIWLGMWRLLHPVRTRGYDGSANTIQLRFPRQDYLAEFARQNAVASHSG